MNFTTCHILQIALLELEDRDKIETENTKNEFILPERVT
jgi:hypothetical protein